MGTWKRILSIAELLPPCVMNMAVDYFIVKFCNKMKGIRRTG